MNLNWTLLVSLFSVVFFFLLLPRRVEAVVTPVHLAEPTVVLLPSTFRSDDVVDEASAESSVYRDSLDYPDVVGDADGDVVPRAGGWTTVRAVVPATALSVCPGLAGTTRPGLDCHLGRSVRNLRLRIEREPFENSTR
jgi:hypothetical protein